MTDRRSFSHAIAEGDGISVIAAVVDAEGARSAEAQRAEAVLVDGDPRTVRDACSVPVLVHRLPTCVPVLVACL